MDFLQSNWKWLTYVALVVAEIIFVIFFKKKSTIVDSSLLSHLCIWIDEAETSIGAGKGKEKLEYVLGKCSLYLGDLYVEKDIRKYIEFLLSLPEKKKEGISNEK